jgi:hypothetical protein
MILSLTHSTMTLGLKAHSSLKLLNLAILFCFKINVIMLSVVMPSVIAPVFEIQSSNRHLKIIFFG